MSEEEFKIKLERLRLVSEEVKTLDDLLNGAIEKALIGLDPELKIELEDPKLDSESYKQIVSKVYSVIRFKLYQSIKNRQKITP